MVIDFKVGMVMKSSEMRYYVVRYVMGTTLRLDRYEFSVRSGWKYFPTTHGAYRKADFQKLWQEKKIEILPRLPAILKVVKKLLNFQHHL